MTNGSDMQSGEKNSSVLYNQSKMPVTYPKALICCIHGKKCKKGRREVDDFSLFNFYIGALDRRQARRQCRSRGQFRLFHELSTRKGQLDSLPPELKLNIVYRNHDGDFYIFPIVE